MYLISKSTYSTLLTIFNYGKLNTQLIFTLILESQISQDIKRIYLQQNLFSIICPTRNYILLYDYCFSKREMHH